MEYLGQRYVVRQKRGGWTYYSCKYRVQYNCPGSFKENGNMREIIKEHNGHEVPFAAVDHFRRALVERALQERNRLREIYDEEAARNPEAAVQYPFSTAYSTMHSARRRSNPPIPPSLEDLGRLLTGDEWAHLFYIQVGDNEPEPFFRATVTVAEGTAVFFAAQSVFDVAVSGVEEMHLDGTFKCVPAAPPSHQLLAIHIIKYDKSIALAYILMSSRRQGLFEKLRELAPTLHPALIMTDYERALRGALIRVFPEAEVVGCFFHYASAVWKMCSRLGYIMQYGQQPNIKKAVKMTMALPLLPHDSIEAGLEGVMAWCQNHQINLNDLFAYIRRFWINSITPQALSVFGLPRRTNNNVEAYNKILLNKMGIHPNIYVFVEKLIQLHKRAMIEITTLENGLRIARPIAIKYLAQDLRVRDAQQAWLNGVYTTIHFLEVMSHAVENIAQDMYQGHMLNLRDDNINDVEEIQQQPVAEEVAEAPHAQEPVLAEAAIEAEAPPNNMPRCSVCLNDAPTHACVPCGHQCMCEQCAQTIVTLGQRCPNCRGDVMTVVQIFRN